MLDQTVRLDPNHLLWPELVAHLQRSDQLRHVSDKRGIRPEILFVGVTKGGAIVGHISLQKLVLLVPSEPPTHLTQAGAGLYESYVQTFLVEEGERGRGLGIALQLAALDWSRELGCYQMRSWSSLDKLSNYGLKLKLGFVFCPGVHVVQTTGQRIPGGWFVKRLPVC